MDEEIYEYGEKVLVTTFTNNDFTGKYYKDGRMEIFYRVEYFDEWMDSDLVETMHNIEEYYALEHFNHHYGEEETDTPEKSTGPVVSRTPFGQVEFHSTTKAIGTYEPESGTLLVSGGGHTERTFEVADESEAAEIFWDLDGKFQDSGSNDEDD
jgi:hypothetical protein